MNKGAGVGCGIAAGFITLVVAMGIGRFLYTPLLPIMLTEYGLRTDQAGLLASLNYIGYLVGAFAAGPLCHRFREFQVLSAALVISFLTTAATGLFTNVFTWIAAVRLLAGLASALAFVSVSGLVLLIIARDGRENLSGLYYGGVGGGIVVTGLIAPPIAQLIGAGGTWLAFALLSLILSAAALLLLKGHDEPRHDARVVKAPLPRQPGFLRLVLSYGLEGFGYIITGTFMVAAAKASVGLAGAQIAWVIAGFAALPSAFFWSTVARRFGRLRPLVAAFFLQGAGIALPIIPGAAALVAGAFLFGATFMGIVTLALSDAASYAPTARARVVGFLTGIYGIGQIVGPALAGYFSARTGNYQMALLIAAASAVAAGAILIPDAFARQENSEAKRGG